ncbi:MAG: hypothetical protein WCJ30_20390, partial [Deltaproteobacteria bacterium]
MRRAVCALGAALLVTEVPAAALAQTEAPPPASPPVSTLTPPLTPTLARTDLVAPSEVSLDAEAVRRACRDATGPDVIGWAITGALAAGGIAGVLYGAVYTPPHGELTPVGIAYLRGISPGLILGAIGTPIGRGVFDAGDPLRALCTRLELDRVAHTEDARDVYAVDRVLRVVGAPPGPALPLLVGLATLGCAVASIVPFVVQVPDMAGPVGGISAAAVAAWIVVPPTPRQAAARRYV